MYRAIEKLLKEEKEYLTEGSIRMPKGTKSAKIFGHADMDGFFSMMLVYNQLIKQGIPKDRIRLDFVQYGFNAPELAKKLEVKPGEMTAVVDFGAIPETYKENGEEKKFRAPDFWSDHHQLKSEADEFHKKAKSTGRLGRTDFGSDSEHIATVNAQGIADYNTIREITKVDSAKFSSIDNNIFYTNEFIGKDRNEKLAILTSALINELIKKNPEAAKEVIRKAKPTLISIYSTVKRYINLTRLQNEAIEELTKDNPDWNIIDKARKSMPNKEMRNKIRKGEKPSLVVDREIINKKASEDIKKAESGTWSKEEEKELNNVIEKLNSLKEKKKDITDKDEKEKTSEEIKNLTTKKQELEALKNIKKSPFKIYGNVVVQNIPSPSASTGRYLPAIVYNKENKRLPFLVRRFGELLQFSLNPDIDNKEGIDLVADMREIIDKAEKKFSTFKNNWAFKLIKDKSGGHAAITNISGLGTLGLLDSKEKRERFKNLKSIDEKISGLKGFKSKDDKFAKKLKELSFDVISKKRSDDYNNLLKEKEVATEYKNKVMDFMLVEFIKLLNEKYSDRKVSKETNTKIYLK